MQTCFTRSIDKPINVSRVLIATINRPECTRIVVWIRSSLVMVKDTSRCFERKERLASDSLAGSFVPDLEKLGNGHTATQ